MLSVLMLALTIVFALIFGIYCGWLALSFALFLMRRKTVARLAPVVLAKAQAISSTT
jgi:hypothetical protein